MNTRTFLAFVTFTQDGGAAGIFMPTKLTDAFVPATVTVNPKYKHNDLIEAGGMIGLLLGDEWGLVPHYIERSTCKAGWSAAERWEDDPRMSRGITVLGNVTEEPDLPLRHMPW